VVLAWHLRLGLAVIPRSTNRERLAENLAAVDVALTDEDVAAIATLETGFRSGPDPSTFG
jgi:2,5-diketo-D-gluconate reductase A